MNLVTRPRPTADPFFTPRGFEDEPTLPGTLEEALEEGTRAS